MIEKGDNKEVSVLDNVTDLNLFYREIRIMF